MRNVLRGSALMLALLATVALTGCGGVGNTPEGIVKRYEQAGKAKDKDALMACLEPESRKFLQSMMELSGEDLFKDQEAKAASVTVKGTKIDGDTATVSVTVDKDGAKTDETIHCVKVDGKWLIALMSPEQMKQAREAMEAMKGMGDAFKRGLEDARKKAQGGEE